MRRVYYVPGIGGDPICLDGDGALIEQGGGLRSHEWTRSLSNRTVRGLSPAMREVDVKCVAEDAVADKLRRTADADIESRNPGTIVVDGTWHMRCYIVASEIGTVYSDSVELSLTVVLVDKFWWSEHSRHYVTGLTPDGLDHDYDYEYDLSTSPGKGAFTVDSLLGAKPRITIYGPATNPYVTITDSQGNANRYEVDVSILSGWKCVIDATGATPTATLYDNYGNGQSVFSSALRGTGTNAFADLPHGELSVSWSGLFSFDIEAREMDSEPPWNL